MSSPFIGPSGIRQRMAEIQNRMDAVFGTSESHSQPFSKVLSGTIGMSPMDPSALVNFPSKAQMKDMARTSATKFGLDPDLFDSLVEQESGYNPLARSKTGAIGLGQLMPKTAEALGVTDPIDPAQNLDASARYLAEQMQKFGRADLALAAYNAGPGAVIKSNGIPHNSETPAYVKSILSRAAKLP